MKRFAIRNYGPSRQIPYNGQHICLSNDACIETDDADLAVALEKAGQVYVTDCGGVIAVPEAPKDDEERKVTVDDAEAVHDEKFPPEPEEDKPQETGGTQPPPESTKDKDEIAYAEMTIPELKVLAKDRQIKTSGLKKAELIQALEAYDKEG